MMRTTFIFPIKLPLKLVSFTTRCLLLLFLIIFGFYCTIIQIQTTLPFKSKPNSVFKPRIVKTLIDSKFVKKDNMSIYVNTAGTPESQMTVVLFWTNYFSGSPLDAFHIEYPTTDFQLENCPSINCLFTSDRTLLNDADGVVFHSTDINRTEFPFPITHSKNQLWIYMQQESPGNTRNDLKNFNNIFNWTMTYRKDSDIYYPYGEVIRRKLNVIDALRSSLYFEKEQREVVQKKSQLVAWMVSDCHSKSYREELVQELVKYIPVDIYGGCGFLKCPRDTKDTCFKNISKNYKFYLAFENSLCSEYATEKFFKPLRYNTVPVVYGHTNYSAVAPPNSFIDVSGFKSVKELADYLIYLDKNTDEYLKFFQWKRHYEVLGIGGHGWCNLCNKLAGKHNYENKVYSDLSKWWFYKDAENYSCLNITSFNDNLSKN